MPSPLSAARQDFATKRPWVCWWTGSTGRRHWWRAAHASSAAALRLNHNRRAGFDEWAEVTFDPNGKEFLYGGD